MVIVHPVVMLLPVFYKDPSLTPFCFFFTLMIYGSIYLMIFSVTQNCLEMIPHCLQQWIILIKPEMIWIMTQPKSENGLSNGKWALIQMFLSRLVNEVIFSCKKPIASHPLLTFNNIPRPPNEILEVKRRWGVGAKIRGFDNILEVDKISLDVLDSDIKASFPENIHYRHRILLKSHFVINIFPEVP